LKWASIDLTIPYLCKLLPPEELNEVIFERPVYATIKYDGTNLGRDETGLMYGRNKTIQPDATAYQKTPLHHAKKMDAQAVKEALQKQASLEADWIGRLVVYGELMCNNLFQYEEEKLCSTCPVFGAMIKPASSEAVGQIVEQLGKAGFACRVRGGLGEDEEPGNELVMLMMNQTYKDLITSLGMPTVRTAEKLGTLYELVTGNCEFMMEGCGEGMVLVSPSSGPNCAITKWKIGAEKNQTNTDYLDAMMQEIEANGEKMFGGNAAKAKEMFALMKNIAESTKKVEPAKAVNSGKKGSKDSSGAVASDIHPKYAEPVNSAQSKFDHCDVYFAKDKTPMGYSKLIAEELLNSGDIAIDKGDKKALKEHEKIVMDFIKPRFAEFKKQQAQ
jgi:hypothetical protein